MSCPICKKPSATEYRPFCSKRCADVDLAHWLRGSYALPGETVELPEEWLRRLAEKHLSEEDKKLVEALGGFEELMKTLRERLEEQAGRHEGGSKWIGTAGTSP